MDPSGFSRRGFLRADDEDNQIATSQGLYDQGHVQLVSKQVSD